MESDQTLRLKYDLTNDKYLDFIKELRLKACEKDDFSHGRPVLPLQADADPPFIDVYLQEGGVDKGLVRIRRYDLRLIKFQDPFGNVLNVDDFRVYDDDSRLVDFGIEGFLLGFSTFIEAVNSAVSFCIQLNNDSETFLRTYLPVLCLVLCEATKLDLLSCMLGNAFEYGYEVLLSSWLLERIHDWEFFSEELLTDDFHYITDCDIYLPYEENDWHCGRRLMGVTCQDVARCLGVIKPAPTPPEPMEDEDEEEYPSGERLVEIYSVSVYLNGGRSGNVYGSIKVRDRHGACTIYHRDSDECESIESHGTLSLQDPDGPIIVENYLAIEMDLREGGDVDSEITKGKALWGGSIDYCFDSRISTLIKGKNGGYAIVYYTVSNEAVIAVVEATLSSKEGHPPLTGDHVCVCGKLCARSPLAYVTEDHQRYYQTILFDRPVGKELSGFPCTPTLEAAGNCTRVKLGETIKLSRTRVSVRTNDHLILKADLKTCDGKPVVTGSMRLAPKDHGESEGIVDGHSDDSHLLQVKVRWIVPKR